ncbi:hypothetical protein Hanom_Chr11g01023981 [Helianthus anomalus]
MILIYTLREMLRRGGYGDAAISYVGGLHFLLVFKDRGEAVGFLERMGLWQEFFPSLALWEGQEIRHDRIACVKIEGVPIKLRDNLLFDKIGEAFGRVIRKSDFSWASSDVSFGRCHVITNHKGDSGGGRVIMERKRVSGMGDGRKRQVVRLCGLISVNSGYGEPNNIGGVS